MSKRHYDALSISNGACNPSGIARTLVAACDEIRTELNDMFATDKVYRDPAIKLIVNQLAFLVGNGEMPSEDFLRCLRECDEAIKAAANQHL